MLYLTWAAIPCCLSLIGRAGAQSAIASYLSSVFQIAPSDASTLAAKLKCPDTLSITTSVDALDQVLVGCPLGASEPRTLGNLESGNYVQFFQAALSPAPMPGGPSWQVLPSKTTNGGGSGASNTPTIAAREAFDPITSIQSFQTTSCQSDSCASNQCTPVVGSSSTYNSPVSGISAATCAADTCQCPTPTASSTWWMSQPYTIKSLWATSQIRSGQSVISYTPLSSCDFKCSAHICYPISGWSTYVSTANAVPATCDVASGSTNTVCRCGVLSFDYARATYLCIMARPTSGAISNPFDPSISYLATTFFHQIPLPVTASSQDCSRSCASLGCLSVNFESTKSATSVSAAYCQTSSAFFLSSSTVTSTVISTVTTTSGGSTVTTVSTFATAVPSPIRATGPMCTCSASSHWLASTAFS